MSVCSARRRRRFLQTASSVLVVGWLFGTYQKVSSESHDVDSLLPRETPFSASAGCPCLSRQEVVDRVDAVTRGEPEAEFCPDGTLPSKTAATGIPAFYCYSGSLGSDTCRAWGLIENDACELHRESVLKGIPESFIDQEKLQTCDRGWCYVDNNNCYSPRRRSVLFPKADLYYSYETCGYATTQLDMLALEPLTVKKEGLRISYPAGDGYRLWRKTGEDTPKGFFPALSVKIVETMKRIPAFSNTPVDIIPITEDAQEFVKIEFGFQSSYTACAVMIALNQTDVCLGPSWDTKERRALCDYLYPWDADVIRLLTNFEKSDKVQYFFTGLLMPFDLWVWLAFLLTIAVTIVLFGWVEIGPRITTINRLEGTKEASSGCRSMRRGWSIYETFWMSISVVLDYRSQRYNTLSSAGKILKGLFALLVAVFMVIYTANLAAILSSRGRVDFRNLDEAIQSGVKICVPDIVLDLLIQYNPVIGDRAVPVGFAEVMDAMDQGLCSAALTYDALYDARPKKHCTKRLVGKPLAVFPASILVTPSIGQQLDLVATKSLDPSIKYSTRKESIIAYNQASNGFTGCPPNLPNEAANQLTLQDMGMLFVLFAIVALFALVLDFMARLLPKMFLNAGAIPLELARHEGSRCYVKDPCKDMFVLGEPPGLHYQGKPDKNLSNASQIVSDSSNGLKAPRASKRLGGVRSQPVSIFEVDLAQNRTNSAMPLPATAITQSPNRARAPARSWGRQL